MMRIDAKQIDFQRLNQMIRDSDAPEICVKNCLGQRYLGGGLSGKTIRVEGVAGNALGAYLNGANLFLSGNAQDATGDTMNDGRIVIAGSSGDATGYAMRGGSILVRGSAGYRAGIHMKAYEQKIPKLIIGEQAGCFLGEYQAGGLIIVLNLSNAEDPAGDFCAAGMHGGKIVIFGEKIPRHLPSQIMVQPDDEKITEQIWATVDDFCTAFHLNTRQVLERKYFVLTPNTHNPYRQLYTHN